MKKLFILFFLLWHVEPFAHIGDVLTRLDKIQKTTHIESLKIQFMPNTVSYLLIWSEKQNA